MADIRDVTLDDLLLAEQEIERKLLKASKDEAKKKKIKDNRRRLIHDQKINR